MTVGNRIRESRQTKGFTQKTLGEFCGIAEPTIRKYESGRLNPKIETLEKIANALGVAVSYLRTGERYFADNGVEIDAHIPTGDALHSAFDNLDSILGGIALTPQEEIKTNADMLSDEAAKSANDYIKYLIREGSANG